MQFEFDPVKSEANLEKHGIDFGRLKNYGKNLISLSGRRSWWEKSGRLLWVASSVNIGRQ